MPDCIFCGIVTKNEPHHEIWWSDDKHIAFLDITPTCKGHTLVITKEHAENVLDLSDEKYSELMLAAKRVAEKMRIFFKTERIAMIVDGLSVDHLHIHLIPVTHSGDLGTFPDYPLKAGELEEIGEGLRSFEVE